MLDKERLNTDIRYLVHNGNLQTVGEDFCHMVLTYALCFDVCWLPSTLSCTCTIDDLQVSIVVVIA